MALGRTWLGAARLVAAARVGNDLARVVVVLSHLENNWILVDVDIVGQCATANATKRTSWDARICWQREFAGLIKWGLMQAAANEPA